MLFGVRLGFCRTRSCRAWSWCSSWPVLASARRAGSWSSARCSLGPRAGASLRAGARRAYGHAPRRAHRSVARSRLAVAAVARRPARRRGVPRRGPALRAVRPCVLLARLWSGLVGPGLLEVARVDIAARISSASLVPSEPDSGVAAIRTTTSSRVHLLQPDVRTSSGWDRDGLVQQLLDVARLDAGAEARAEIHRRGLAQRHHRGAEHDAVGDHRRGPRPGASVV